MAMPARTNGEVLHLWLRLLGWQIETGRDGDCVVGVGTHVRTDGTTLRVGGCAPDHAELLLQLFEQAMLAFERDSEKAQRGLRAA